MATDAAADRSRPLTGGVEHYSNGSVECIDGLRASMSDEQFIGFCKGNVMKYLWRFEHKGNPLADLQKAADYLEWLRKAVDRREWKSQKKS